MNCGACRRPITDEAKRVEFRECGDGTLAVYGIGVADGTLDKATGRLVKVLHSKCYWLIFKREKRGRDAAQGTTRVRP